MILLISRLAPSAAFAVEDLIFHFNNGDNLTTSISRLSQTGHDVLTELHELCNWSNSL